jgi:hypothetical protein
LLSGDLRHIAACGRHDAAGRPYAPRTPREAIDAGVSMAAEDRHQILADAGGLAGRYDCRTISLPHLGKWFPTGFTSGGRDVTEAELAVTRLGIKTNSARATLASLSGGNQQKVILGRWEAEPCRLLLLDEPFQGVDVGARQDIIQAIRANRSRATLIATSDPEEALEVADRILHIDRHTLVPGASVAQSAKPKAFDHDHPGKPQRAQSPDPITCRHLENSVALLRSGGVLFLLIAMLVGFWIAQPVFINLVNLMSILQAVSVVAILGVGVTLTLAVGGFRPVDRGDLGIVCDGGDLCDDRLAAECL